jgi:hypothetical protein
MPSIATIVPATLNSLAKHDLRVRNQERTNACTGFAAAAVVDYLLRSSKRERTARVSPFMLYSMARRYDEFPGYKADGGSSLRGAMKGWYKHGACSEALWRAIDMPDPDPDPRKDWWQDAAKRPLGAYYRVETASVTDMHVALCEAGVLYASAICHRGWDEGFDLSASKRKRWAIPGRTARADDGGHAFVIIGYDENGFLVLNSWGTTWGDAGLATLTYDDWTANAMDCWVAQLGVCTELHQEIGAAASLRVGVKGTATIASEPVLRNREIAPFIVDMENDGALSSTGEFRTQESDVRALVTQHLATARQRWHLVGKPIDIAVYAHGGLTGENTAAATAARWIPALYDAHIFPVFLMWETDLFSTLKNRLVDFIHGEPRPTGGLRDEFLKFWNRRLEQGLAGPGSVIWGEMKQNAQAISSNSKSGARILWDLSKVVPEFTPGNVRLHLIGHSAGTIVHSYAAALLCEQGWTVDSMNFLAAAVRADVFKQTVAPRLRDGGVKRYNQFHLTDDVEKKDPTVRPLLGYSRSLLYLVSESFEGGKRTPIVGMEKYFSELIARDPLPHVRIEAAPSSATGSTTHGGFDDDAATMASVIDLIKTTGGAPAGRAGRQGRARTRTTGRTAKSRKRQARR